MLSKILFAFVSLLPLYVHGTNRAITEWTAMGDSYASGVGAGEQPEDDSESFLPKFGPFFESKMLFCE